MDDIKFPSRGKLDLTAAQPKSTLPFKELHSDDPPPYEEAIKFTDKLFKSDRHTFTCLKAIFGIFCGLLFGAIIFILLVYCFSFGYDLAGYITIGWTVLSCIALATSVHARCITFLMIPSLFTGRGRAAILAIIFALLLSRPIKNIAENTSEVSRSMACSTELFHNQSISLQQQLQVPIEKIKAALGDQVNDIKNIGRAIKSAVEPLYKAIVAVKNGVKLVSGALDTASQECDRVLGGVYSSCINDITTAYQKCRDTLSDVKKYVPGFDLTPICKILDVEEVCVVVKPDVLCSPVKSLDKAAEQLAEKAVQLVNGINKWFQFDVINKANIGKVYNASKTVHEIIAEVESELTGRKNTLISVLGYLNKLLALSIVLLLIQSYFYLKNYLAKDEFDNIYITTQFKDQDAENKRSGKPAVLPLQNKEKTLYIDSNSPKMSPREKRQSIIGTAQILLHMLLSALVVFLNYVLYYILYLVNKYGRVNVEITGESQINLRVNGGQMATLINKFIENINIENTYEASYNTTICLPNPKAPDVTDIPILCGVYFAALILVLMQAYGARYSRKICAFYYPEQENERIIFLQKKILHNRKSQEMFMKQHVKSLRRQKLAEKKMSVKQMLSKICPCFQTPTIDIKFCMNCGKNESSTCKLKECKKTQCGGVYCVQCFTDFGNTCPICCK